mmetsp:Transcript_24541/g.55112  ORF Transcript_24541/g.55112 Transcript_24541/m.55112 type:complete len:408 (-) Transcript_24541:907-2130(-)
MTLSASWLARKLSSARFVSAPICAIPTASFVKPSCTSSSAPRRKAPRPSCTAAAVSVSLFVDVASSSIRHSSLCTSLLASCAADRDPSATVALVRIRSALSCATHTCRRTAAKSSSASADSSTAVSAIVAKVPWSTRATSPAFTLSFSSQSNLPARIAAACASPSCAFPWLRRVSTRALVASALARSVTTTAHAAAVVSSARVAEDCSTVRADTCGGRVSSSSMHCWASPPLSETSSRRRMRSCSCVRQHLSSARRLAIETTSSTASSAVHCTSHSRKSVAFSACCSAIPTTASVLLASASTSNAATTSRTAATAATSASPLQRMSAATSTSTAAAVTASSALISPSNNMSVAASSACRASAVRRTTAAAVASLCRSCSPITRAATRSTAAWRVAACFFCLSAATRL